MDSGPVYIRGNGKEAHLEISNSWLDHLDNLTPGFKTAIVTKQHNIFYSLQLLEDMEIKMGFLEKRIIVTDQAKSYINGLELELNEDTLARNASTFKNYLETNIELPLVLGAIIWEYYCDWQLDFTILKSKYHLNQYLCDEINSLYGFIACQSFTEQYLELMLLYQCTFKSGLVIVLDTADYKVIQKVQEWMDLLNFATFIFNGYNSYNLISPTLRCSFDVVVTDT